MKQTHLPFEPEPGDAQMRRAQSDPAWRRKHHLEPAWHFEAGGIAWGRPLDGPVEGVTSGLLC